MQVFHNRLGNPYHDYNNDIDGAKEYGISGLSTRGYPLVNWGAGPIYSLSSNAAQPSTQSSATTYGASDTISVSKGRHFIKAGVDARNLIAASVFDPQASFNFSNLATSIPQESNAITGFTGYSFASYLLGCCDERFPECSESPDAAQQLHRPVCAGRLQGEEESYVEPGCALGIQHAGIRVLGPPEQLGPDRYRSGYRTSRGLHLRRDCNVCTGKRYYGKRDFNNFGPRVGFAYQASKDLTIREPSLSRIWVTVKG